MVMHVWIALLVFVVVMTGLLSIKRFAFSWLLIPLIVVVIFYKITSDRAFKRPLDALSMHACADLDRDDEVRA